MNSNLQFYLFKEHAFGAIPKKKKKKIISKPKII